MIYDLQKAMIWKRISAWLFDAILMGILVVGLGFCLSSILNYDSYSETVDGRFQAIEEQYHTNLSMSLSEYENLLPEQKEAYEQASEAFASDEVAGRAYGIMINLTMVISSLSSLAAFLILEFAVPLWLHNGQTLGKKIFSIGVMSVNGVRVSAVQMFIRTVLGKFTIETMIPLLVGTLVFFGSLGFYGTLVLLGLFVLQLVLLGVTRTNSLIHDLLAKTVVVDLPSQMIFESESEMLEYKSRMKAEMEARQDD